MAEAKDDKTQAPEAPAKGAKPAKQAVRNLQDTFLAQLRETQTPVTVFLVSGVKLQGRVTDFDGFTVALTRDGATQLVYKRVISTIAPLGPLDLSDGHRPPGASPPRPPRPMGPRRGPVSRPIIERRKLT